MIVYIQRSACNLQMHLLFYAQYNTGAPVKLMPRSHKNSGPSTYSNTCAAENRLLTLFECHMIDYRWKHWITGIMSSNAAKKKKRKNEGKEKKNYVHFVVLSRSPYRSITICTKRVVLSWLIAMLKHFLAILRLSRRFLLLQSVQTNK